MRWGQGVDGGAEGMFRELEQQVTFLSLSSLICKKKQLQSCYYEAARFQMLGQLREEGNCGSSLVVTSKAFPNLQMFTSLGLPNLGGEADAKSPTHRPADGALITT